ncbi:MAG: glycoside hydrolase family 30 beta sandwich domain-containing protein [Terracidiphilus sp.]
MKFIVFLSQQFCAVSIFSSAEAREVHDDSATPFETPSCTHRRLLPATLAAAFLLLLAGPVGAQAQTATVNWANVHQTIQGFGAYNAWAPLGSYQSLLFNTLGYSLLRASLPTDDSCSSGPSSDCGSGVSNTSDMQYCVAHGCKVWASVSSPPADMKTNGSTSCTVVGATLLPGDYGAYATYISNYIASLATYFNIPLYGISPQNEPDTCFNGTQTEAFSAMSSANLDTFIKTNLGPTLAAKGQSSTLIMMPETGSYGDLSTYAGTCMADSNCSSYVGITAFHDYDNASSPTNPYSTAQFWETETSGPPGPSLCSGCWDPSIADALMWAKIVHTNLVNGVTAWHYFWYVDPTGSNENSGLINPAMSTPISIRTYAIAQWAKFVRPGWVRIDATVNPVSGVDVTAFKNPSTSEFAIVAVNENASSSDVDFSLTGFTPTAVTPYVTSATLSVSPQSNVPVSDDSFTYTLSNQSITTFVGSTLTPSAPTNLTAKVVAQ